MDDHINFLWNTDAPIATLWSQALHDPEFVTANNIHVPISPAEQREARQIVFGTASAPSVPSTPGAALAVRRLLSRYDFEFTDEYARIRSYTISRLLDLAESEKESTALGALTKLGAIADVGLFETKVSVDIKQRPTAEIESEINTILGRYLTEKVVSAV